MLSANDVALFAVSYDPVEALATFANRHGITYPLLADAGSEVIRRLGLLNEQAPEQVAGICHPGVYVLDNNGIIIDKRFYQSYRERETGAGLLEQTLRIAAPFHGAEAHVSTEAVGVRAWLDSPTFGFSQRLWLTVELAIASGFHVYCRPTPEGYTTLSIEIDNVERLQVGEPIWPESHPFRIEGLDEDFCVYEGTVRVSLPVTFAMKPGSGNQVIRVAVTFQACTQTTCLLPEQVRFDLPVEERDLV